MFLSVALLRIRDVCQALAASLKLTAALRTIPALIHAPSLDSGCVKGLLSVPNPS